MIRIDDPNAPWPTCCGEPCAWIGFMNGIRVAYCKGCETMEDAIKFATLIDERERIARFQ